MVCPGIAINLVHIADMLHFADVVGLVYAIFVYPEVTHPKLHDGENGIFDSSSELGADISTTYVFAACFLGCSCWRSMQVVRDCEKWSMFGLLPRAAVCLGDDRKKNAVQPTRSLAVGEAPGFPFAKFRCFWGL